MADKTFYPSFNYGFARVYLEFSFLGNNTSSSLVSSVDGVDQTVVASITRSGAGVQAVLLGPREKYNKVIWAGASVDGSTGQRATIGNIINEGSSTLPIGFTVYTWATGGTAADVVSAAIRVSLCFRNSASGMK